MGELFNFLKEFERRKEKEKEKTRKKLKEEDDFKIMKRLEEREREIVSAGFKLENIAAADFFELVDYLKELRKEKGVEFSIENFKSDSENPIIVRREEKEKDQEERNKNNQKGFTPIQIILFILAGVVVFGGVAGGVLYFAKPKDFVAKPEAFVKQRDKIKKQNYCEGNICYDSPFGFLDVPPHYFEYYNDLGTSWLRGGGESFDWGTIEKNKGKYDFSWHDSELCDFAQNGQNLIYAIRPINSLYGTSMREIDSPDEYPDGHLDDWGNFIQKFVERYDGDGVDDAGCSPAIKIKNYQLVHELGPEEMDYWQKHRDQYAETFIVSYNAIKKSCGDCVLYMPVPHIRDLRENEDDNFLAAVLSRLKGKGLADIGFDYHDWSVNIAKSPEDSWKTKGENYGEHGEYIKLIKKIASKYGFDASNIISAESGMAGTLEMEPYQAAYVVKMHIFSLSRGQKKIFWTSTKEYAHYPESAIFAHTGLIHNPQNNDGLSHKKLAYYAYKKMVEILEGSDWNNIQIIKEKDGVYVYKFNKNGKPIWAAWNDNPNSKTVEINAGDIKEIKITEAVPKYKTGEDIGDYNAAFNVETKSVFGGKISIAIKDRPMFLEGK